MALADYTDANSHLDNDKIKFLDNTDATPEATNADRYVKGALGGTFPDHVLLWISELPAPNPNNLELTPALIAEAAGLFMAAERYRKTYSLEETGTSAFADGLEARAKDILKKLQDGELTLYDTDYASTDAVFAESDFWPNNTTTVTDDKPQTGFETGDKLRFADMTREF